MKHRDILIIACMCVSFLLGMVACQPTRQAEAKPLYVLQQPPVGTAPVYEFRSSRGCFYTISESEKNELIARKTWTYKGIAFYAYPPAE